EGGARLLAVEDEAGVVGDALCSHASTIARNLRVRNIAFPQVLRDLPPVARPGPGLRERKKDETRRALREAALRLALEHGPDQVRVDDIAAAAGVSTRTYNNYFSSREQAIVAAVTAE